MKQPGEGRRAGKRLGLDAGRNMCRLCCRLGKCDELRVLLVAATRTGMVARAHMNLSKHMATRSCPGA
jgi:hypothetical protein